MDKDELRKKIINDTIDKLSKLTGEDFHGYRSEVWNVISLAIKDFDSAPSGLQAQRECPNEYCGNGNVLVGDDDKECQVCHGTGFITRDLTQMEAIELFKAEVSICIKELGVYPMMSRPGNERVIVKEEK